MKKLVAFLSAIAAVLCMLFSATAANASMVGPCIGLGLTTTNVVYGTCGVTSPAHASAIFSSDGSTVTLKKVSSGQVASFWQSNGPITGSASSICVTVSLDITARASGEQRLVLSANGHITSQSFPLSAGIHQYCSYPPGDTNVWWQLITYLEDKPNGRAIITETLVGVAVS